jgi:hypothetical protein
MRFVKEVAHHSVAALANVARAVDLAGLIVRRQSFWDNGLGKIREVLAHRIVISGG